MEVLKLVVCILLRYCYCYCIVMLFCFMFQKDVVSNTWLLVKWLSSRATTASLYMSAFGMSEEIADLYFRALRN
jgi:hypothetical protein